MLASPAHSDLKAKEMKVEKTSAHNTSPRDQEMYGFEEPTLSAVPFSTLVVYEGA
jgi:hypothetical protein